MVVDSVSADSLASADVATADLLPQGHLLDAAKRQYAEAEKLMRCVAPQHHNNGIAHFTLSAIAVRVVS